MSSDSSDTEQRTRAKAGRSLLELRNEQRHQAAAEQERLKQKAVAARKEKREEEKEEDDAKGSKKKKEGPKKKKRAPLEVSSKKPFSVKELCAANEDLKTLGGKDYSKRKESKAVDPRFSDIYGELDVHAAARNYAFVDDIRQTEMKNLQKRVKKGKRGGAESEDAEQLKRLQDAEKKREQISQFYELKRELRDKEKSKILSGKKAYFHSKQTIGKLLRQKKKDKMGVRKAELLEGKKEKRKAAKEKSKLIKRRE